MDTAEYAVIEMKEYSDFFSVSKVLFEINSNIL